MSKERKVPVQKGTIISNPPTLRQMPYTARVRDREDEIRLRRHAQTLDYDEPRTGKRK
jgi:hypothetical protein